MRNSRSCSKCSCRNLFVITKVRQPDSDSPGMSLVMPVTSGHVPTGRTRGFSDELEMERLDAGFFEAWVCSACGFTEWYARESNEVLARLAQHADTGVVYLDGGDPTGPYR